jgi:adenylosuccinate synthase
MNNETDNEIVLGAQFGDESKGKYTSERIRISLLKGNTVCLRINGGANAGHTILIGDEIYDTHLCPSGIVHDKCMNIIGNGVLVNIVLLYKELDKLKSKRVNFDARLFISSLCHVSLMIHSYIDFISNKHIGTTNTGIGPTAGDKYTRCGVRMESFLKDGWETKIVQLYSKHSHKCSNDFSYTIEYPEKITFTSLDQMMHYEIAFIQSKLNELKEMITNTHYFLINLPKSTSLIIEGANAFMLDTDFGTYPYVTSTSCTIGGVMTGSGLTLKFMQERNFKVVGICKGYITRVGGGILPSEDFGELGELLQSIGNEIGVTTGRKRRCGPLDLVQLKYAHTFTGYSYLNITKLDVLSKLETVSLCIGYIGEDGNLLTQYPTGEEELSKIQTVQYEVMPGWKDFDISQCKVYSDLHPNIQKYIEYIELYVGIQVKYINTGPKDGQLIVRQM